MDHFFSAIEERENPGLKGKPLVVGADPKRGRGRGVVKTCNYEARQYGIHSGMPVSQAWELCPEAIYVRANYSLYVETSKRIMSLLRRHADAFQRWGLDEAFLDVSSRFTTCEQATTLGENIKYQLFWQEGLTCSIGIGPNKLIAKIASDHIKPDGLTVVAEEDVRAFLAPLPVRRLLWVGQKTESRFLTMGIKTIGDLAAFSLATLVEKFGVMGTRYHQWAQGIHDSEVSGRKRTRKSAGHEITFDENVENRHFLQNALDNLSQRVHEKLVSRNYLFKTVTVKIRSGDFQTITKSKTLSSHTNRLQDLQKTVNELSQDSLSQNRTIRLVGVRVSNLYMLKGQKTLA
ncbi:MAG: DNA polymerase IV [Candidatus Bathyarchaeota archaeon]|nr:MAG: DNA polymerase IV [Candidatus Bathyarchaeota archaeon]